MSSHTITQLHKHNQEMGSEGYTQTAASRPHVVVVPYPSQGHINPLLQFAKRLSSHGVRATFATTTSTLPSISTAAIPNIEVAPIADGFDSGSPAVGKEADFLFSFKASGSKSLSKLIASHAVTDAPVCCVVYDAFLPWAVDVARSHGVRCAAFFTNSATVSVLFTLVHRGRLGLPLEVEAVRKAVPAVRPAWEARDLPSFLRRPDSYPAYLEMKLSQFGNLELADWVFCNSFADLESEFVREIIRDEWPAKLIGPMVPSAYLDNSIEGDKAYGASLWKPLSEECLNWLETKPPRSVVYVSFGSMASLTPKQTAEIGATLRSSDFPFLWVIRDSQLNTLPDGFLESTREKGLIVTWCDQLEVLAHRSVGCFVTHCGWNSTLEGLSLGVPMVAVPQWTDQPTDAKFIAEVWRVGVWAAEDEEGVVGRAEFRVCLEEVMSREGGGEMRRNAVRWRELARKAVSKGGSSAKHIEDFVEYLTGLVMGKKGQIVKDRNNMNMI